MTCKVLRAEKGLSILCYRTTNLFVDTGDPLWKVGEGVQGEVIDGLLDLGEDLTERSGVVRTGLQSTDLQVDLFLHGKQVINLTWKKTKRPEF